MKPLDGDRKPYAFLNTSFDERAGQFSPDGHWVAYQSNESEQCQIFVRPFPGPGARSQVSTHRAGFRRDGAPMAKSCTTSLQMETWWPLG